MEEILSKVDSVKLYQTFAKEFSAEVRFTHKSELKFYEATSYEELVEKIKENL